jgi:uncharacterized protein YdbL (DUF1318 family)
MSNLARRAILEDISQGNATDAFFGHLADAELSDSEIKEALAQMAEAAAARKDNEAKITEASIRGVEHLTGGVEFERERARGLRRLAQFFRI